jgi:hypothetical protein
LIRSQPLLQRKLLDPNWRIVPAQFDLPSGEQFFLGIAVLVAGFVAASYGLPGALFTVGGARLPVPIALALIRRR